MAEQLAQHELAAGHELRQPADPMSAASTLREWVCLAPAVCMLILITTPAPTFALMCACAVACVHAGESCDNKVVDADEQLAPYTAHKLAYAPGVASSTWKPAKCQQTPNLPVRLEPHQVIPYAADLSATSAMCYVVGALNTVGAR
eukprot:29023-Chlamydomonas_euryale.AAC.14